MKAHTERSANEKTSKDHGAVRTWSNRAAWDYAWDRSIRPNPRAIRVIPVGRLDPRRFACISRLLLEKPECPASREKSLFDGIHFDPGCDRLF